MSTYCDFRPKTQKVEENLLKINHLRVLVSQLQIHPKMSHINAVYQEFKWKQSDLNKPFSTTMTTK